MEKRKILVLAYCVSPYQGSEFAVAWNYISYMSRHNSLTVLFGCSDNNLGETQTMDKYIQENFIPDVSFVAVKATPLIKFLNWPNVKGFWPYSFYYAYRFWHKQVYKMAKELLKKEKFDLVHYVGPIGYREPGYLWKLGLPYVWGPIGGANNVPVQLLKEMSLNGKLKFLFRNVANTLQFHINPRLKKALSATDILLTATTENREKFLKAYYKDSIYLPENGIIEIHRLNLEKFKNIDKIRLIIVGRLCLRKAVRLLLEALKMLKTQNKIHLDIVGDGPEMHSLKKYAHQYFLDDMITWHGQLPRNNAVKLFDNAHLNVITSISEGNPTTIWEAMSYGVPTMSFDHCGMHDILTETSGIRIPIHKKYKDCVTAFANGLDAIVEHPDRLFTLAEGTLKRARQYLWSNRVDFFNSLYDDLVKQKNEKNENV